MLDQTLVSGMGNIYCDEALYRAKINPRRKTNGLSYIQLTELWTQSIEVLREALEQGGTSFDSLYVNVNGASGYFERSLRAYGRGGQPCLKCGAKMKKIQFDEPLLNLLPDLPAAGTLLSYTSQCVPVRVASGSVCTAQELDHAWDSSKLTYASVSVLPAAVPGAKLLAK